MRYTPIAPRRLLAAFAVLLASACGATPTASAGEMDPADPPGVAPDPDPAPGGASAFFHGAFLGDVDFVWCPERLREADVVVYDALVHPDILEHVRPEAERIFMGKRAGEPSRLQPIDEPAGQVRRQPRGRPTTRSARSAAAGSGPASCSRSATERSSATSMMKTHRRLAVLKATSGWS